MTDNPWANVPKDENKDNPWFGTLTDEQKKALKDKPFDKHLYQQEWPKEAIDLAKAEEKAWKELTGITPEMLGVKKEWGSFPLMEGVQSEKAPVSLGYDLGSNDHTTIAEFKDGQLLYSISLEPIPSVLHFIHAEGDEEDVEAIEVGDLAIYRGPMCNHILHLPTWTSFDSALPKPNKYKQEALIRWCKAVQGICLEEWAVLKSLTPDNYNQETVLTARVKRIIQELCLGTKV